MNSSTTMTILHLTDITFTQRKQRTLLVLRLKQNSSSDVLSLTIIRKKNSHERECITSPGYLGCQIYISLGATCMEILTYCIGGLMARVLQASFGVKSPLDDERTCTYGRYTYVRKMNLLSTPSNDASLIPNPRRILRQDNWRCMRQLFVACSLKKNHYYHAY